MTEPLATRLRRLRLTRRLKLKQLAGAAGVSLSAVNYWERGTYRLPAEAVPSLADALGVSVDYLLRGATPPPMIMGAEP